MRYYIKQYYKPEITVAYNGPKKEAITVVNTKKAKLKNDEIRMAYAGNLGLVQGMDQLLEAFGKIRKSDLTNIWHLDIYGTGALEEELKSQSQKMGINENVHFHGALPKEILSTHLREADVLYLGLISSEALDKTIPSKLFDYLIFGKPILAAITGEGKDILENNQANLVLASCDSENIVNGIVKLDKSLNERSLLASGNIELLSGNYTREVNCQKIHLYLQEVIEK
jgi:glycosyltransferase involved in cell wall biosynthesis